MTDLDFDKISNKISTMEKSTLSHSPYAGPISLEEGIKISPSAYVGFTYEDVLNLYERIGKIRKTSEILSGKNTISSKKTKEAKIAESAIKDISKESSNLTITEPVESKEPLSKPLEPEITFEKPTESHPPKTIQEPEVPQTFEKENEEPPPLTLDAEPEKEVHETKSISPIVFESELRKEKKEEEQRLIFEKQLETKELTPEVKHLELPYLVSHIPPTIARFPSIEQDSQKLGLKKYDEIVGRMESVPGKMSKKEIKTQMLTLTKQLFKQKLTSEREKIKKEIIRLKNLLIGPKTTKKTNMTTIIKSLPNDLNLEVHEYSSSMNNLIYHSILKSKSSFYTALSKIPKDDGDSRKTAFELFSSDLSSLKKQSSEFAEKTSTFLKELHIVLLKQIKETSGSTEGKMCDELISKINTSYDSTFTSPLKFLNKLLDLFLLKAKNDSGISKNKSLQPIFETLDLNDENLLNYLQSKHKKKYKNYLDKEISKIEALSLARKLYSKEKGLSNELLSRYFVS